MKKYWRLFWQMRRIQFMRLLEYRANFLFWMCIDVVWTGFTFFFFSLLINVNGNIAGWSADQMYLLLGVFTLLDAVTWSFFYNNMTEFTKSVFDGSLNIILTKPVDVQYWLMTRENSYSNVLRFLVGSVIIFHSLRQLHLNPSALQWLWFAVLLLAALAVIYFFWFMLSTLAFYVDRLSNINEILPNTQQIYQVPHTLYTGIASTIFTVLIPLGLASSVPSQALLGNGSLVTSLYLIGFSVLLILLSRMFFSFSIKRYSGIAS